MILAVAVVLVVLGGAPIEPRVFAASDGTVVTTFCASRSRLYMLERAWTAPPVLDVRRLDNGSKLFQSEAAAAERILSCDDRVAVVLMRWPASDAGQSLEIVEIGDSGKPRVLMRPDAEFRFWLAVNGGFVGYGVNGDEIILRTIDGTGTKRVSTRVDFDVVADDERLYWPSDGGVLSIGVGFGGNPVAVAGERGSLLAASPKAIVTCSSDWCARVDKVPFVRRPTPKHMIVGDSSIAACGEEVFVADSFAGVWAAQAERLEFRSVASSPAVSISSFESGLFWLDKSERTVVWLPRQCPNRLTSRARR